VIGVILVLKERHPPMIVAWNGGGSGVEIPLAAAGCWEGEMTVTES